MGIEFMEKVATTVRDSLGLFRIEGLVLRLFDTTESKSVIDSTTFGVMLIC